MKVYQQQLCVLLTLPLIIFCCDYKNETYVCDSLIEIALQGKIFWKSLVLNSSRPVHLPSDSFKTTPFLNHLTIYAASTDNSFIENGTFDGLSQLRHLDIYDLYSNELFKIQTELPITNLTLVHVTDKIPERFFEHLPNIRRVNITANSLKVIEAAIFSNTSISHLFLDNNKIQTIEKFAFIHMNKLIKLTLSGNELKSFESSPLGLGGSNLRELWLDHNQIDYLDRTSFVGLQNLQFLSLSFNKMHGIDYSALTVSRLGFLDLSNNKLQEFLYNGFPNGLKWLDTLLLHNNKINHLIFPTHLNLQNLREISLGGNPFQCPCLAETEEWLMRRGIGRVCDEEHTSGNRPACVYTQQLGVDRDQCVNITNPLYKQELITQIEETFERVLLEYPQLKECHVAKGYYS